MRAHVWTHKYVPGSVGAQLVQFCMRCGIRVDSTIPHILREELLQKNLDKPEVSHEDCDSVVVHCVMES